MTLTACCSLFSLSQSLGTSLTQDREFWRTHEISMLGFETRESLLSWSQVSITKDNIWHVPIWWPSHPGSLSYSLSRGFAWKPAPCLPLHSSQLIFIGAAWVKHRCEGSDAGWSNNFYNKCLSLSPKEGMTVLIMLMDVGIGSLNESIGGYFWELVRKLQENKTRVL